MRPELSSVLGIVRFWRHLLFASASSLELQFCLRGLLNFVILVPVLPVVSKNESVADEKPAEEDEEPAVSLNTAQLISSCP